MSLTGSAIALIPDMPETVMLPEKNYTSTSDAVLSRRHIELAPINDGLTFATRTNNELVFQIASTNSFLDMENFYISGSLAVSATNYTGSNLKRGYKLLRTGVSALIDSIEIRSASTMTTFDKLEGYNVFCGVEDNVFMTRDALRSLFVGEYKCDTDADLGSEFSVFHNDMIPTQQLGTPALGETIVTAASSTTQSTQDLFETGSLSFASLENADISLFDVYYGKKTYESSNRGANGTVLRAGAFDEGTLITPVSYARFLHILRPDFAENPGSYVVRGTNTDVLPFTLKLRNGFFRQKNDFPLFLLPRGFQIVIKFDSLAYIRGFKCMSPSANYTSEGVHVTDLDTLAKFEVSFTNLRSQCILKVMHSSINQMYLDLYTSGKGLLMPFTSYRYYQKVLSSTSTGVETIDINIGVRSARTVWARLVTTALWNGSNIRAFTMDTINMAMNLGLGSYQFKSGALDWPVRQVEFGRLAIPNVLEHQKIAGKLFREQNNTSYRYEETPYLASQATSMWGKYATQGGVNWKIGNDNGLNGTCAPYSCIGNWIIEDIGRDNGFFSGTDVSLQPLRVQLSFDRDLTSEYSSVSNSTDAANWLNTRLLQCFIGHDAYLFMSESNGISRLT